MFNLNSFSIGNKAKVTSAKIDEGKELVNKICEVVERLYGALGCKRLVAGEKSDDVDLILGESRSPKANFLVRALVVYNFF